MKRNNVAKKLGIASLCLAFLIPVFSGITTNENKVAVAEGTAVALSDFVTVSEGATVSQETRTVYTKKNSPTTNQNCLRVSSDVPYEATFNRVFSGNSTFRFAFPNERPEGVADTEFWGDFKFRFTDAADEDNFFDIGYTTHAYGTAVYVEWNGHTVNCYGGTSTGYSSGYYRDTIGVGSSSNRACFAPAFFGYDPKYDYGPREGALVLSWSGDVLTITANPTRPGDASDNIRITVAEFDGTYNANASKTGFTGKNAFGFPKMNFPHGYKVSFFSSYTNENTTDQASDVSFWKITNDGTTYEFDDATTAGVGNNYTKAYDTMTASANAGKTLLGWKDAEGALHSTATALASADISAYTPVYVDYGMMNGASVRIDTSADPKSGIRFMSLFNVSDYASVKDYITSRGTLIAYNSALTRGRFDAVNYATQIAAATQVAQVENSVDKVFTYIDQNNNSYKAYSMALVGITDNTQVYAARGYIVVTYADNTTATFYTDYNATNNNRSIAEVAYKLAQSEEFNDDNYNEAQQKVVNDFAADYVAPEA